MPTHDPPTRENVRGMLYDPAGWKRGWDLESPGLGPVLGRRRQSIELPLQPSHVRYERAGSKVGRNDERLAKEATDPRAWPGYRERIPALHAPRAAMADPDGDDSH